ncbi:hypothetical protein CRG98_008765 [Punica granatum]|uniref:Uncharacterized protein n=1 Tax=Punica granatum TaxID=22663 RepID=A0A2I0KQU8_PUNGR|nr:hypothetical protein CRG98_008765 [Punica granatum]
MGAPDQRKVVNKHASKQAESSPNQKDSLVESPSYTDPNVLSSDRMHAPIRVRLGMVHLPGGCVMDTREKESPLLVYDLKIKGQIPAQSETVTPRIYASLDPWDRSSSRACLTTIHVPDPSSLPHRLYSEQGSDSGARPHSALRSRELDLCGGVGPRIRWFGALNPVQCVTYGLGHEPQQINKWKR